MYGSCGNIVLFVWHVYLNRGDGLFPSTWIMSEDEYIPWGQSTFECLSPCNGHVDGYGSIK